MGRLLVIALVAGCGSSPSGTADAGGDGGVTPGDGSDGSTASCPSGTWCTETAAIPATTVLRAVWAASANDAFAVGDAGVILRRVNGTWTQMTSNTTADLHAVWGFDGSHVWAGGAGGVVRQFDGTNWSTASIGMDVDAIWGTAIADTFFVGPGAVVHFNGATFSSPMPLPGSPFSISGVSSNDVWVTGESSKVSHFTGSWTTGIDPGAGATYFAIAEVAANDVWVAAAGNALHFNGTGWTPHSLGSTTFVGFYPVATSDIWAVGGTKAGHWDGNQWFTEQPAGASASLHGVHGAGASLWVVGDDALILHRD